LIYEFSSIPDIPYFPEHLVLVTRIFHLQLPAVSLELILVITARPMSDIDSLSFLIRESADRTAGRLRVTRGNICGICGILVHPALLRGNELPLCYSH